MDIIEKKKDGISIFEVIGRLDSNTSPAFEKRLFDVIEKGSKKVIVDFKDLDYISSAGLRVILKAAKTLRGTEDVFILCSLKDYVKEVFEISGFDAYLPITSTIDEALSRTQDEVAV